MRDGWSDATFAEIAAERGLAGGPFGSNLGRKDYVSSGVPVLRGQNLSTGRFVDYSDCVFVTEEKLRSTLVRNTAEPGDVIFTQRGTLGQVAVMPEGSFQIAVISQSQMRLRVSPTVADPWFVFYFATSPEFLEQLGNRAIVTGVPHINLGILSDMRVPLPPLDEQGRIAGVLGALDDLIDTNQRLIGKCRELAAGVFPTRCGDTVVFGEIAELGRQSVSHDEIELGTAYLGLEHFGTGGVGLLSVGSADAVASQKSVFNRGDVLYGKLRPYFRKVDRPSFGGVATSEAWVIRPKVGYSPEFVFSIVHSQAFTDWATLGSEGTRMPRAGWKQVGKYPVCVPLEKQMSAGNHAAERLWQSVWELSVEADQLRQTRDELLPLLMSGAVSPAEVAVAS
jgi:type I restriction enzyme S subunit